jgi:hypothetical protein
MKSMVSNNPRPILEELGEMFGQRAGGAHKNPVTIVASLTSLAF